MTWAQENDYRAGHNFMATQTWSVEQDQEILAAFAGLRVADVSDGMDFVGLDNVGLMDPAIHPLWKDTVDYAHRIIEADKQARRALYEQSGRKADASVE